MAQLLLRSCERSLRETCLMNASEISLRFEVIAPEVGRVPQFRFAGVSFLRFSDSLAALL